MEDAEKAISSPGVTVNGVLLKAEKRIKPRQPTNLRRIQPGDKKFTKNDKTDRPERTERQERNDRQERPDRRRREENGIEKRDDRPPRKDTRPPKTENTGTKKAQ